MPYSITTHLMVENMTASTFNIGTSAILTFGDICNDAKLHVPPHVARATAAAFNRAMQATQNDNGSLAYVNDAGTWLIGESDGRFIAALEDVGEVLISVDTVEQAQDKADDWAKTMADAGVLDEIK